MISIIAQRMPADTQGPDISDPLITDAGIAIERGRNEIDHNCSSREMVTTTGPLAGWMSPGRLVEVADSEQYMWRGMIRSTSIVITRGDDSYTADINLTIERVAK